MKVLTQNSDRRRTSVNDPENVRKTYAGKGSLKTAANIVTQRGWLGLYSGFRLQLGKSFWQNWSKVAISKANIII